MALVLLACAVLAPSAPAFQQPETGVTRPSFANRVVAAFDFEEPSNPLPVPTGWIRGQNDPVVPRIRPGFPIWNLARLDSTRAHTGSMSVRLPTRGGSTSLILRSGALPVLPGADYRVAAWVRTEGLVHARACLEVTLLDPSGNPIPGRVYRSKAVRAEREWTLVDVEIFNANAAFMQLDLLLLQPDQYLQAKPKFDELITLEDVSGSAWFDDVTVAQLPQIELKINRPGNIIPQSELPTITIAARDLTGEDLAVRVRVLDIDGKLVDEQNFSFRGGRLSRSFNPRLNALGWYRAVVEISDSTRVVGAATLDFAWVLDPDATSGTDDSPIGAYATSPDRVRFGVIVQKNDPAFLDPMVDAIGAMGVGAVSLPLSWGPETTDGNLLVDRILPTLRSLNQSWVDTTVVLDQIPGLLADQLGLSEDDVLAMFELPRDQWAQTMLPPMDRLGQFVRRWQVGPVTSEKLVKDPNAASRLDLFEAELRRLVPEESLTVPWPIDLEPDPDLFNSPDKRTLVLPVPANIPPSSLASAHELWAPTRTDSTPVQIAVELQDETIFGYRYAAENFVKRVIEAWGAFGPAQDTPPDDGARLAILEPWVWPGGNNSTLLVRPEAPAMRNLIARLQDRSASSDLDLGDGIRAILLEPRDQAPPARGSALALWATLGNRSPRWLDLYLGKGPVDLVDIFGNQSRLEVLHTPELDLPYHHIPINAQPIFLEGIDANLVRFLAQLALDPAQLESADSEHVHDLVVTNPWPVPLQGQIYIVEPGGFSSPDGAIDRSWRIKPRVVPILIDAGETQRFPLNIVFGPFEETGPRELVLDVDLNATEEYGLMRIQRTMMLGSSHIRVDGSYRLGPDPGGPNAYIDADILNTSAEPLTCRVTVFAAGFPRNSASITALAPGQSARRSFVLPGGATGLKGGTVAISVEVPDLGVRLNRSIHID